MAGRERTAWTASVLVAVAAAVGGVTAGGCASRVVTVSRDHLIAEPPGTDRAYLDELLAKAHRRGLSAEPGWRKLLHYQRTWSGNLESEADGPRFFLSPVGRVNARAELDATLRGFFAEVAPGAPEDIEHPICQFPARWRYLVRELAIDPARLRVPACPRFQQFHDNLDASSVTLVFSSYYLNNPASAFGHTFLRFNSRKSEGAANRELLDFAINFSATTDTNNSVAYAIKGLVGSFPGEFTRVPYYLQVRKYNDFESRDLWSYDLNLTPDDIEMMIAHFWELGATWFDYFYMTENCSYHILGALEAAVPRLDLVSKTRVPVTPADTVKIVHDVPGLVGDVSFRPAIRAQVNARVHDLSSSERALTVALADDPKTAWPAGLPVKRRAMVLDAALDLNDMRYAKELPFDLEGVGNTKKQVLLERRAELAVPSAELRVPIPHDKRPDHGHGSRRIGLFGGATEAGAATLGVNLRLTLHDLADPSAGYPDYAALEFLPVAAHLVLDDDRTKFRLDEAHLVRITSLSPQSRFERRASWKAQLGAVHLDDEGCHDCTAFRLSGGGGAALATTGGVVLAWFTGDLQVVSARGLDGLGPTPIRLGVGPAGGVRLRFSANSALLVAGEWIWLPQQNMLASYQATSSLRWRFVAPLALAVEGRFDNAGLEGQLGLYYYY